MPTSRLGLAVSAVVLLAGTNSHAQEVRADRLPACYELKLGPWTPALAGARPFSTPPDTLQLFDEAPDRYPQPGWKRAGPPIRHAYSGGRERAVWRRLDSASVRVIWSDGFTGAELRLYHGSDAHYGLVRAVSDARGPEATTPQATVVAKQVACGSTVR